MNRIKTGAGNDTTEKSKALDALVKDDYLSGPVSQCRVDLDKKVHKGALALSRDLVTDEGKRVSFRMIFTEAMLDVLDKYERGEGNYKFDDDVDWSWSK